MTNVKAITSLDNARVKQIVKLRRSRQRKASGLFIAEGLREVSRALEAKLVPKAWFACPTLLDYSIDKVVSRFPWQANAQTVEGFEVSEKVLEKMAYRDDPEGLIAVFEQPTYCLNDLVMNPHHNGTHNESAQGSMWLIGVGLAKPGNLGAMARTAKAAGCAGMIAADAVVDPFNPNAIRASTGAVFSLPIVSAPASEVIHWLTTNNIRTYAAALTETAKPHTQVNWQGHVAIVIGAEDTGLNKQWIQAASNPDSQLTEHENSECGGVIQIPMAVSAQGAIDSLNASVAAGIVLFEAVRQRHRDD
jgi:RNA methyltransferase, TrmH family